MIDKRQSRLRRARQTRARIAEQRAVRLTVHRSNLHIYAQVIDASGTNVIVSASTLDKALRAQMPNGGNVKAAALVGQSIAQKAREKGIEKVAFDRSGYKYHGRVKALAEAARQAGLKF
jgi:large subunit ribosomal protein L18